MDDIAIYFEKFDLGNEMYAFKPVGTIRGIYDKEDNSFLSESGVYCESILGGNPYENAFFGYQTTIDHLKKVYGSEIEEQVLLTEYFSACTEYFHLGIYDYDGIKLFNLHYIASGQNLQSSEESINPQDIRYQVDKQYLQNLRDCKNITQYGF